MLINFVARQQYIEGDGPPQVLLTCSNLLGLEDGCSTQGESFKLLLRFFLISATVVLSAIENALLVPGSLSYITPFVDSADNVVCPSQGEDRVPSTTSSITTIITAAKRIVVSRHVSEHRDSAEEVGVGGNSSCAGHSEGSEHCMEEGAETEVYVDDIDDADEYQGLIYVLNSLAMYTPFEMEWY